MGIIVKGRITMGKVTGNGGRRQDICEHDYHNFLKYLCGSGTDIRKADKHMVSPTMREMSKGEQIKRKSNGLEPTLQATKNTKTIRKKADLFTKLKQDLFIKMCGE